MRKYTTEGVLLWSKRVSADRMNCINDAAADSTGVYVAGQIAGTSIGLYGFVRKYSPTGAVLWTREWSAGETWADYIAVNSSGVYVAGTANWDNPDGMTAFVRKYSPSGALAWSRTIETADSADPYGGMVLTGSGLYIAGSVGASLGGQPHRGQGDAYLRKYSLSGRVEWTKQVGSAGWDYSGDISPASSGGVYFSATLAEGTAYDSGSNYTVRRYNADSTLAWSRSLGRSGDIDRAFQTISDSSGLYLSGDNISRSTSVITDWVRKFSPTGASLWTQTQAGGGAFAVGFSGVYVTQYGSEVAKLRRDTGALVWVKGPWPASGLPYGGTVLAHSSGVYIGGSVSGRFSGYNNQGGSDAWLAKLAP